MTKVCVVLHLHRDLMSGPYNWLHAVSYLSDGLVLKQIRVPRQTIFPPSKTLVHSHHRFSFLNVLQNIKEAYPIISISLTTRCWASKLKRMAVVNLLTSSCLFLDSSDLLSDEGCLIQMQRPLAPRTLRYKHTMIYSPIYVHGFSTIFGSSSIVSLSTIQPKFMRHKSLGGAATIQNTKPTWGPIPLKLSAANLGSLGSLTLRGGYRRPSGLGAPLVIAFLPDQSRTTLGTVKEGICPGVCNAQVEVRLQSVKSRPINGNADFLD
ncbi:hypothetical protein CPB84DRAFT_709660 [Gymnopilus junonius]|uniref:Uncharacterized protein n=1 Tax=Gymnopilus junonius TaxID=109634 RepID=A0A9P5TP19_GYMJU|nr:hypothetical protein CPB84DRAFT_709660 [Gymnopilus junonius]